MRFAVPCLSLTPHCSALSSHLLYCRPAAIAVSTVLTPPTRMLGLRWKIRPVLKKGVRSQVSERTFIAACVCLKPDPLLRRLRLAETRSLKPESFLCRLR